MYVCPGTSQIHADTFAQSLGVEVSSQSLPNDWAFLTGVSPQSSNWINETRKLGTKVAAYWIGTDSICAIQDPEYRGHIAACDKHFCVHERIQKELKLWGVDATVIYPCARNPSNGLGRPKEVKVGVYMPYAGGDDLYMFKETCEIAAENPDLPFVFFGCLGELPSYPENVRDAGRLTPEQSGELQDSFSCLLRLCRHDGNPIGGIEMKQRNRHVISNYPYDGFLYAATMEEINEFMRNPETHEGDFGPYPAYYREKCSKESFKKQVMGELGLL